MSNPFRYKRIMMYSSLQFCGHREEYFAARCEHVVFYIPFTRCGARPGLVREYRMGSLVSEYQVPSSGNMVLYYLLGYLNHLRILLRHFRRDQPVIVHASFPVAFFGLWLQRLLRRATFVYMIGDYFPPTTIVVRLFNRVQQFYHDRVACAYYLSDRINRQLNGTVLNTPTRHTVMWGVKEAPIRRDPPGALVRLLMVGQIKPGQGLSQLLDFVAASPDYTLEIVGVCPAFLYQGFMRQIGEMGISGRVHFPNLFLPEPELHQLSRTCHIGIALYDTDSTSATNYCDPGKVKAYTEMGLPLVMTDISDIARYVREFRCGEVIRQDPGELAAALQRIRNGYPGYVEGLRRFNAHFAYEAYYEHAFIFLERNEPCQNTFR